MGYAGCSSLAAKPSLCGKDRLDLANSFRHIVSAIGHSQPTSPHSRRTPQTLPPRCLPRTAITTRSRGFTSPGIAAAAENEFVARNERQD